MITHIDTHADDVIANQGFLFLGSRLKRLAEQMQTDVAKVTQRAGIAVFPGQFPLLAILSEKGPQTVGALSHATGISQPVTTRNISKLIEAGLVDADRSDADGRSKRISLTLMGQQAMQRSKQTVFPHVEAAVKEVMEGRTGPILDQIAEIEAALKAAPLAARAARIAASMLVQATDADIPPIVDLMNAAYRGTAGTASWTTEASYMKGSRTTRALLREEIRDKPDGVLLTWRAPRSQVLRGSVWLEPLDPFTWYLGSLTVDPKQQNSGLGQALLFCAEQWVQVRGGKQVRLTVINVRESLISWYLRRGYVLSGATEPFPYGDTRFGTPLRDDLHFVVLTKAIV